MDNYYRVEVETPAGTTKRIILSTETRAQAYAAAKVIFSNSEVLSITKISK